MNEDYPLLERLLRSGQSVHRASQSSLHEWATQNRLISEKQLRELLHTAAPDREAPTKTEREKWAIERNLLRLQRDEAVAEARRHESNATYYKKAMIDSETETFIAKRQLEAATMLLAEMGEGGSLEEAVEAIVKRLDAAAKRKSSPWLHTTGGSVMLTNIEQQWVESTLHRQAIVNTGITA